MSLLNVSNLDAGYGDLQVLSGIDLHVDDGEYVTIVGPNGAGKSTVMKTIIGLATHQGGEITLRGADIAGAEREEAVRNGIGYVPQSDNVFPTLTIEENLRLGAYVLDGFPDERKRDVYDRFPALADRTDEDAGSLSGGQQQMLAMGCALILAPDLVDEMFDRVDEINEAGTTVLMVEQNAKEALRRCDRGYVLAGGENRYEDAGTTLLNDQQVRQDFLGG